MENIRLIQDFIKRLQIEGHRGTPFTWLIGAGMSFSSGIPLAKGVSQRIILFEFLAHREFKPWDNSNDNLTYDSDLEPFFEWYENSELSKCQNFKALSRHSIEWLKGQRGFDENIDPDSPQCYPLVFKHLLQNSTTHHLFLTKLLGRTKGINLAHLALAGILRDHPEWGHTVFTTNFDDLLLKALLTLNHTARVFGDLESQDIPVFSPTYPQIVHLHGRHTGYRLVNTIEQMALIDQKIQRGFIDLIRNSHLIVLGYSGWDDFVMKTLNGWRANHGLIKGDLFWVPFESEENILPQAMDFFEECPPGRVHIIVDEKRELHADSFMLTLCHALNRKNGGFAPYRKGIIDFASRQHAFTLNQLIDFKDHNPCYAVKQAKEAIKKCVNHSKDEAEKLIEESKIRISAEDLPSIIRGQAYWLLGIAEMLLHKYSEAINSLNQSLTLLNGESTSSFDDIKYNKAANFRALGEAYLRLGNIRQAKDFLRQADTLSKKEGDYFGFALAKKLLSEIELKEGSVDAAKFKIEDGLKKLPEETPEYVRADFYRISADIYLLKKLTESSKSDYQKALSIYKKFEDFLGIATVTKGLGDCFVASNDYDSAKDYYERSYDIYSDNNDKLGCANIKAAYGGLDLEQGNIESAISHFEESLRLYQEAKSIHGECNAKTSLLICYTKLSTETDFNKSCEIIKLSNEIKNIIDTSCNGYALEELTKLKLNV